MSTNRTFQAMLNEWLNYDLLKEEFIKRDYLIQTVDKDNGWKGGTLPVPFKGAFASSVRFGKLTPGASVTQDKYVRGEITTQPEVWGTMKFNHRDLMEHNGKVKEQSFLKLLPGALEEFMDNMKNAISIHLLSGGSMALATADTDIANGKYTVDRIERFCIGQKFQIKDDDTAVLDVWVLSIDVNLRQVVFTGTFGGVAGVDLSAYTTAANAKFFYDDSDGNGMTSLKDSLLSLANGGSANLYGQSKLSYPYLQAINLDGAGITATNIHEKIFDGYTTIKNIGKGNPATVLMSYKHLGNLMKVVEHTSNVVTATNVIGKGAYKVEPGSMKTSLYGWTEIKIHGVRGVLTVVGIQEMDDDNIMFIDWRSLKFHSNNFFVKRTAPDGKQYYEVREEEGYYYLIDIALFGDLVLSRPSYCGIYHSIP